MPAYSDSNVRNGADGMTRKERRVDHEARKCVDRFIDSIDELHSSPAVAWTILNLLKDPEFDVHEIERHLEADPALAASILRLVNSACYGLPQKISSLRQALMLMGARSLRLAVLSFGLVDRLTRGTPVQVYQDFWRRALTTAVAGSHLCQDRYQIPVDEVYSAGLLADIGVLALSQVDTDNYVPMYLEKPHGTKLSSAELETYGFHHGVLGAALLRRWGLPQPLPTVAENHHVLPTDDNLIHRAVFGGTLLADVLWTPDTPLLPLARKYLHRFFNIGVDDFITLAVECKEDIADAADMFAVELQGEIDCEQLKAEAQRRFRKEAIETSVDYDSMTAVFQQDYGY